MAKKESTMHALYFLFQFLCIASAFIGPLWGMQSGLPSSSIPIVINSSSSPSSSTSSPSSSASSSPNCNFIKISLSLLESAEATCATCNAKATANGFSCNHKFCDFCKNEYVSAKDHCPVCSGGHKECSICLSAVNVVEGDDKMVRLMCNHVFHEKCIEGWRKERGFFERFKCPYCRKDIVWQQCLYCMGYVCEKTAFFQCNYTWCLMNYQEKHYYHEPCLIDYIKHTNAIVDERGRRCFMCLAHQKIHEIPEKLRKAGIKGSEPTKHIVTEEAQFRRYLDNLAYMSGTAPSQRSPRSSSSSSEGKCDLM